jgi:hypothetical protein
MVNQRLVGEDRTLTHIIAPRAKFFVVLIPGWPGDKNLGL